MCSCLMSEWVKRHLLSEWVRIHLLSEWAKIHLLSVRAKRSLSYAASAKLPNGSACCGSASCD